MSNLKLIPLSTGRFLGAEKSNFTYAVDQGIKIQSPILMWFIDGARHKILVDTGVSDPEWAARYHHPIERKPHEDPINAIESLGLRASDIDIIINTHLHWDHCFNNHLFPNARILVQAEELRYAISPLPCLATIKDENRSGCRRRDGGRERYQFAAAAGSHQRLSGRCPRPAQWSLYHCE